MRKRMRLFAVMLALFTGVCFAYPRADAASEASVFVMHKASGQVIKSSEAERKRNCAGLMLLPALLVISEAVESGAFDISGKVTVSRAAAKVKGATAFIEANERIAAEDLYKSAAIICAGDAIYALAEAKSGNSEGFVEEINERLEQLGIECTYNDIVGTDAELSAVDIARIASALSDCECYLKYSGIYMDSIEHYNGKKTELVNQNRLIRNMQGCKGLATGSSNTAGYCGAFYTERNQCEYICVVLGASSSPTRFELAQNETEAAYASYKEIRIAQKGEVVLHDYPISGAIKKGCDIVSSSNLCILTDNNAEKPKCTYEIAEYLTAPVKAGECVGNIKYTDSDGKILGVAELSVKETIEKAGFWDFFKIAAEKFMKR